jgi:hypothetical protein
MKAGAMTNLNQPGVQRSKRAVSFTDWFDGDCGNDDWHHELDKWMEWLHNIMQLWMPRLLRACAVLCEQHSPQSNWPWREWAAAMERAAMQPPPPQAKIASKTIENTAT